MMRKLAIIGLSVSCLLADNEPKQRVQVTNTQRVDFPSGGVLRMENSIGELMVEGWDRPNVEITTIKSTKAEFDSREREKAAQELNQVTIAAERRGDDLVVKTGFPRHGMSVPPLRGSTDFDLEYYIRVPKAASIVVDHDAGSVRIDNVTGDIRVTDRQGEITLRLPNEGQYLIDARSKFGSVISDLAGHDKRKAWLVGHQFTNEASAGARKLYLRIGYGDIIIWKTVRLR